MCSEKLLSWETMGMCYIICNYFPVLHGEHMTHEELQHVPTYKIPTTQLPVWQQEKSSVILLHYQWVSAMTSTPLPVNQGRSSCWSVRTHTVWRSRPSMSQCVFTQPYRPDARGMTWWPMHRRYDTCCTHIWEADAGGRYSSSAV